ncbi:FixH family protein [Arhodomonas sp. AD133]|uniref:FixH family protein n=1 Tax=Arhodomonas sp. AD133 TaxID=3415009 RepID=UPI003EBFE8D1
MQPTATAERPWYRHPWPWLLAIPPVSAIIFWAVIITTMAGPPSLVIDDYAKVGLVYEQNRTRDSAAARLDVAARLQWQRANGEIRVAITRGDVQPTALTLRLSHPTDAARDHTVTLTRDAAGLYTGRVPVVIDGRRHVQITPPDSQWRLSGSLDAQREALTLAASGDRS